MPIGQWTSIKCSNKNDRETIFQQRITQQFLNGPTTQYIVCPNNDDKARYVLGEQYYLFPPLVT